MVKNILKQTTELARVICREYIDEKGIAIDATCGNGHDTLWLAENFAEVYAFDIQQEAVCMTEKLLEERGFFNVKVIRDSHSNMAQYVKDPANLIMFNLGYLPGGDKNLTTEGNTTVAALETSLQLLKKDGLISIIIYWGHPGGEKERERVLKWAETLDKAAYHCIRTDMVNQHGTPPEILFITKKK